MPAEVPACGARLFEESDRAIRNGEERIGPHAKKRHAMSGRERHSPRSFGKSVRGELNTADGIDREVRRCGAANRIKRRRAVWRERDALIIQVIVSKAELLRQEIQLADDQRNRI